MLFGSKNVVEFEKAFDEFLDSFSDEELLNELKVFSTNYDEYEYCKNVLGEIKDECNYEIYLKDSCFKKDNKFVGENILNDYDDLSYSNFEYLGGVA